MKYLEFMFSGFWTYVGCLILLAGVANAFTVCFNRFFRHWNIRKHGYPPAHCDADGDFKTEEESN